MIELYEEQSKYTETERQESCKPLIPYLQAPMRLERSEDVLF